jgi:hypothetical protein
MIYAAFIWVIPMIVISRSVSIFSAAVHYAFRFYILMMIHLFFNNQRYMALPEAEVRFMAQNGTNLSGGLNI